MRSNFQKRYEQTEAPARVVLPKRAEAGPRDAVNIRAFLDGYRQREVSVRISSSQREVHLDLEPLPNRLDAVSHTYLAGRAALAFLTKESLTVQVQEVDGGFRVILSQTAKTEDATGALVGVTSPLIQSMEALQLGEDLLVRAELAPGVSVSSGGSYQLRRRQARDELRDSGSTTSTWCPPTAAPRRAARARRARRDRRRRRLGLRGAASTQRLRESLEPAALARALAPRGELHGPLPAHRDEAPRRGVAGRPHRDARRLELQRRAARSSSRAAMSQPGDALGYLALLRTFVDKVEPPDQRREHAARPRRARGRLRAASHSFVDAAEQAERQCLASR